MDIKNDSAILQICRTCEKCTSLYEITTDLELKVRPAACNACRSCYTKHAIAGVSPPARTVPRKKIKTLPSSGYSSLLPYQIPQVKETLEVTFGPGVPPPRTIVDATAHIGGDTINFAKLWPECKITSIDIDEKAIKCLDLNVKSSAPNPENIEIICADSTVWIRSERRVADFYYFDPPWGGPNHSVEAEMSLYLSDEPVTQLIKYVLGVGSDEDHPPPLTTRVVLKAPKNFSYSSFKKEVAPAQTRIHYIRKPQKKGAIAYALILVWV